MHPRKFEFSGYENEKSDHVIHIPNGLYLVGGPSNRGSARHHGAAAASETEETVPREHSRISAFLHVAVQIRE